MNSPPRAIVIEDHAMVRNLLSELLNASLGLDLVAECGTVADGVRLCRELKPDLAIVDWMLLDGRGFDVIRGCTEKLPRLKWIVVSSNEQGHLVREAVRLGVHGFVMKRADLSTLRTAITKVLAGETYYCPVSAALLVERMVGESRDGVMLSARESAVLRGFASGENPKALADRIGVSTKTVQNVLSSIKEKLGLHEPAQLVHYAIKHGYIEAP